MDRVLITGANRGLGLEFARQYAQSGMAVIATCRQPDEARKLHALGVEYPERVSIQALDVTDAESIDALVQRLENTRLDVLINNAGVSPRGERFDTVEASAMLDVFHVNSVAPLVLARKLRPLLAQTPHPRIVNISSAMGSLTRKDYGRHYSYAASKAALNMITRAAAHDLEPEGIIVVALHPGWVQTDLGGSQATLSPAESVAGMRRVVARLRAEDSGSFLTWAGQRHPW
jgi:NAD(P)-dependent dehydrogenase (short-subunit alcohol dehydrogenase family)